MMKYLITILILIFSQANMAQKVSNSKNVYAPIEQSDFTIKSEILGEDRKIIIHLPKDYDTTSKDEYSVVYLLDGGNFDVLMAKVADSLFATSKVSKVIVVGIENIRRGFDFTPPYEQSGRGDNRKLGNGDKFISFIKEELIPEINKKFRTNNHKILVGHSWGGAFASYLLSESPELFDGFFLFSPTFLYGPTIEESTKRLRADLNSSLIKDIKLPEFIYISLGQYEDERFKESAQYFADFLKNNIPSRIKYKFEVSEGADHMQNPVISIPRALIYSWSIN